MNLQTKRRLTLVALIVLGWAIVTLPWPTPFNSARWQQFHHYFQGVGWGISLESDVSRARMVDALIREKLQPGLSFEEGRALLGEPEVKGSGHGSSTTPYQQDGYPLVHQPFLQLPGIWLRWRTGDPYLWVRYERGKFVSAIVE